jgi:hypothetical protein
LEKNATYLLNDQDLESSEPNDSLLGKSTIEPVPELMGLGQGLDIMAVASGTVVELEGRVVISSTGIAICKSLGW